MTSMRFRARGNNVAVDSLGVPFNSIPVYEGRNVPAIAWSTYPENIYAQYENEDDYYQDTNEALDEKRNAMQAKNLKDYEEENTAPFPEEKGTWRLIARKYNNLTNEFLEQQKEAEAQEAAQERFRMGYTKSEPMDDYEFLQSH